MPHSVSVLGISVETSTLSWVGPVITLALLAYFTAHIAHLRSVVSSSSGEGSEYPWIGLFQDWLSSVLLIVSLGIMPPLN